MTAVDVSTDTISIEGVTVSGVAALLPELTLDAMWVGNEAFAIGTFTEGLLTASELMVYIPEQPIIEPIIMEPVL